MSTSNGTMGLTRLRAEKVVRLAATPAYWRSLKNRVIPATEHVKVDFRGDVTTVFDVGASRGQFALFALQRFPSAHVVCFEPLSDARRVLERVLPDQRVAIHPIALGTERSEVNLHVSRLDDSSSLLPIGYRQIRAFPGTQEERIERVRVGLLRDYLTSETPGPTLLKIDVQGYELPVLRGAGPALAHVDEIYAECSFVELYTGQALIGEVVSWLRNAGFGLAGVYGVVRARSGTCLQADCLFRRTS
jgi:FkbM family methyltransferase